MDLHDTLKSQYEAALRMLDDAIEKCPEQLWIDSSVRNPFWRLAYHTLFYTHLYLSSSEATFVLWEKSRPNLQFMGKLPWPPHDTIDPGEPYTRSELRQYLGVLRSQLGDLLSKSELDGPAGFDWIPFSRMELMLYNLRHLQHHGGQLADRIAVATGQGVVWVGYGSDSE